MEFDKVISKRKSVKSFKNKKASWKDALEAIDSAIQAPFPGNHNHLKFLIIEDQETINKISELSNQSWINNVGLLVVVCSDDKWLEEQYGDRGRVYSRQSAGAAIENMILKLTDMGLDSCWVGEYKDADIRRILKAPSNIQIEAIIPIGYEQNKSSKKRKLKLENVLFWEKWGESKREQAFKEPKVARDYETY